MTTSEIIEDFEDALKMGGYGDYLDKESIEFALKTIKETYPDAKGNGRRQHDNI